ncbi:hypothetical protein MMC14_003493 [Varicellaria rhodocarpa]|nr:hypothetical protein [Varicellaria rhodocarpa]
MASSRGMLPECHGTLPTHSNGPCVIIVPVQMNIQNMHVHCPPIFLADETVPSLSTRWCANAAAFIRFSRERKVTLSIFNTSIAIFALIATITLGVLQITGSNVTSSQEYRSRPSSAEYDVVHRGYLSSLVMRKYNPPAKHPSVSIRKQSESAKGIESCNTDCVVIKPTNKPQTLPEKTSAWRSIGISYGMCSVPAETSPTILESGVFPTTIRGSETTETQDSIPSLETPKNRLPHELSSQRQSKGVTTTTTTTISHPFSLFHPTCAAEKERQTPEM